MDKPKIKLWLSAMRLRTLPLSVSGILVASSFAEYNGFFNWTIFILAILTTISFQILSNLANDYGDGIKGTDNDERVGPQRALQSGGITPEEMFNAIKMSVLICIVLAFGLIYSAFGVRYFLLSLIFFTLGILSIIAAIKYTMGKTPYGYKALGDVFVFIFFGLVSLIGCYVLYAKHIDHIVFLPACAIGLLSVTVLNLNNMRDVVNDEKVNKITIPVKLGIKKAKYYHLFLVGGAIILTSIFGVLYYVSALNLIFMVIYVPLIVHLKTVFKNKTPKLLDSELKKLALSTFFLALLLAIGYLL